MATGCKDEVEQDFTSNLKGELNPWRDRSHPINLKGLNMENYRIYCEENERAEIMTILRKYNDVVVDNVNSNSFGITIERDNPEELYQTLLEEIDREVYQYRQERNNASR